MQIRLSVVAPCLNEDANVDTLVDRTQAVLADLHVPAEVVLVDDGSVDNTWRRIRARADATNSVVGVRHERNAGIEAAWASGLDRARGDLVCLIDADLQNRPEDIARLYQRYVESTADIVQAVRLPAPGLRRLLAFSRGLNALLNLSFGTRLRDGKSGFILCRRDVLSDVLTHRFRYRYFQSFIGASACARGYEIAEVETEFQPRRAGESFLSGLPLLVSLRIVVELLKARWELVGQRRIVPHRTAFGNDVRPENAEAWNDQFSREHDIDAYYASASAPIRWIEGRRLSCIRELLDVHPGDRVLEVGCGGGHVLRLFPQGQLTGTDVSGIMLEKARRNLNGYRVRLLKGELSQLGLPDQSFDRIVCTEVLEHAVDPGQILEEIRRLIRPGGTVVITFPNDRLITKLKQLARFSGLTLLPSFRRISWGADHYHLHVWSRREMRQLLGRHLRVVRERSAPASVLPVRCCFECHGEPGPPPAGR